MYKIETDSSASEDEEKSPIKRKPSKKKINLNNTADPVPYGRKTEPVPYGRKTEPVPNGRKAEPVPYGRKRSCWKRSYSEGEKLSKSVPEAGIITCAICGIQRYYKFIKQTKKFGLHSCEPCRKFISAMIANVRNGTPRLFHCITKGPENCLMSESITQNGVKTKRDALSNIRCKACWLALCLQKYEMHPGLKNSLAQFIAEDDRPSFLINNAVNALRGVDFDNLTKKRSQRNHSEKSCIKAVTSDYIQRTNLLGFNDGPTKKVVIFRIKDFC